MWRNGIHSIPDPAISDVEDVFDADALRAICALPEEDFGAEFGLDCIPTPQGRWSNNEDYYFHRDNGSSILAVAHLDTVVSPWERTANIVETEGGLVIHSGALDDRLGAYVILDMLPKLGMNYDLLLTVGEESGNSTAQHFEASKQYDWLIEFDRGGTDVVMYNYEDHEISEFVSDCGAKVGVGIFSDICYLEHLNVKGFNWGVGYQDYHSVRGHAWLEDTFSMVAKYRRFDTAHRGTFMPHYKEPKWSGFGETKPWWHDDAEGVPSREEEDYGLTEDERADLEARYGEIFSRENVANHASGNHN